MDGRKALKPGTVLRLSTSTGYSEYTVCREIGRGGSCIVYDASYRDTLGNDKLVRVKECYPHAPRIDRDMNGTLRAGDRDIPSFEAAKARMTAAYRKNHELFMTDALSNSVANSSNLYEANGTVYIVSTWMNGQTFADAQGETLHDCVALILSVARVLRNLHEAGYLYLDLKPENILTIRGSLDLVQLFDFDSMVSLEDMQNALRAGDPKAPRISCTRGFAPVEQLTGRLRQIGKHSDLYSLGAVLFHALWRRPPSAFDCEEGAAFDFPSMTYASGSYQDALFRELTVFLHRTLASYHGDRYRDAAEAIEQLKKILALSDNTRIWLRSAVIQRNAAFYGRKKEMAELDALLAQNEGGIISLYGMGGIGKSSLARAYLHDHRDQWDAVLWLYDQDSPEELIADDTRVFLNTVHRMPEESAEEYLSRKLTALRRLASEQRILLVLDNFITAHLEQLKKIAQVGWTILLISRERLPEGLFPAMRVGELEDQDLKQLFEHYSHRDLEDGNSLRCFNSIQSLLHGHPLMTELIARHIASSYLDLRTAEEMITEIGFVKMPGEKIDYVRDQSAWHDTLPRILDRLMEIDRFSESDRVFMKLLSLFDLPGIEAEVFRWLTELPSLEFVNDLEKAGWLKADGTVLSLHPVTREYIYTWPWEKAGIQAADQMMRKLYDRIRPAGKRHDGGKQFPENYETLHSLLRIAEQLIRGMGWVSEASQRLRFRILMDAPVDQDASVLSRMMDLLKNPRYLEDDSILRLYENAAYLQGRLNEPEKAVRILGEMKRYLLKHPSAYYLSAYHSAMAVILHNADEYGNLNRSLRHEEKAIAAARVSTHPEGKKQLAASLLTKATSLLSADLDRAQAIRLIAEAKPLVEQYAGETDFERYQYVCVAAMRCAMDGEKEEAEDMLNIADQIAYTGQDSELSIVEHLLDQAAPIRIVMGQYEQAEEAVLQAIQLCDRHEQEIRYLETRVDAYRLLGDIYAMDGQSDKAEEACAKAEHLHQQIQNQISG